MVVGSMHQNELDGGKQHERPHGRASNSPSVGGGVFPTQSAQADATALVPGNRSTSSSSARRFITSNTQRQKRRGLAPTRPRRRVIETEHQSRTVSSSRPRLRPPRQMSGSHA